MADMREMVFKLKMDVQFRQFYTVQNDLFYVEWDVRPSLSKPV